ncbi:MAG: hypothetical protein DRH04_10315, partial [Deltaproteobacteria bacterium]
SYSYSYLYRNNGNETFTDVSTTVGVRVWTTYGAAWADYNNDGFMDLVTGGADSHGTRRYIHLFRNSGNSNHWIKFNLTGVESNRDAVGARVKITLGSSIQVREVTAGSGSHGQQSSRILHFGLGTNTSVDKVEIRWPSGTVQMLTNLAADRQYNITEAVSGPRVSSMSASKGLLTEDETVTFTVQASGAATYMWDFDGDGTWDTSGSSNQVSHAYALSGEYYPAVLALDASGGLGFFETVPIRVVNADPQAELALPDTVSEDEVFTADASNSTDTPSDADKLEYNFSFGDGTCTGWSANATASHSYPEAGTYTVSVYVRDDDGNTSSVKRTVAVENVPPWAVVPEGITGHEDSEVRFTAAGNDTPSDRSTLEYRWDFGDSHRTSWSQEPNATHTYTDAGNYTAVFSVRDDDGAVSELQVNVSILGVAPQCTVGAVPTVVSEDDMVSLTGSGQDTASDTDLEYMWDFGDGNSTEWSDTAEAYHTYTEAGSYTAVLTVRDDDGLTGTDSVNITVVNVPPTGEITEMPAELDEDQVGTFSAAGYDTASDTPSLQFLWDFGDGTTAEGMTVNHSYAHSGTYTVVLTVRDDDGGTYTAEESVEVKNMAPTGDASASSEEADEDQEVLFTGSCTDTPSDSVSMSWHYEKEVYGGGNLTLVFHTSGVHRVRFVCRDDDGAVFERVIEVRVRNVRPELTSLSVPENGTAGVELAFSACAADTPSDVEDLKIIWDFGDGTTAEGWNATHTYAAPGTWKCSVTVTDDDGDSDVKTFTVLITGEKKESTPQTADSTALYAGIGAAVAAAASLLVYMLLIRGRGGAQPSQVEDRG